MNTHEQKDFSPHKKFKKILVAWPLSIRIGHQKMVTIFDKDSNVQACIPYMATCACSLISNHSRTSVDCVSLETGSAGCPYSGRWENPGERWIFFCICILSVFSIVSVFVYIFVSTFISVFVSGRAGCPNSVGKSLTRVGLS